MAVAQHLAEAEAELFFLVVVSDALDLGDEGGVARLPGQVEIRFVRQAGYGRAAVLDGSSKRQQPHCRQLPAITRYQPSDLRR